jgi:putative redox protein
VDAKVTWEKELTFVGVADGGYPVRMSSPSGPETGVGPVELTILALAACTAMDVISILSKKQERVSDFHVSVHAERAESYAKVITSAELEYVVCGEDVREASLLRAIELSIKQYCPVHAMLSRAFPIELKYSIFGGGTGAERRLVKQGRCPVLTAD